jgi:hypothetical protein
MHVKNGRRLGGGHRGSLPLDVMELVLTKVRRCPPNFHVQMCAGWLGLRELCVVLPPIYVTNCSYVTCFRGMLCI